MDIGKTIFAQLMDFLPVYEFHKCVQRYNGHYKVKHFSCWNQFLCMAFAQLTYRESLRDIEACLRSAQRKLYHMGFRSNVSRNTLAHAFGVELNQTAYALDSTTIDLCLSLFPWAKFRAHKAAVKLHTLLDLRGSIPSLIIITHGKVHDVNILDQLIFEPGAFYIIDRGYLDFDRLYAIHQASAFFVTRAKGNFRFRRLYSRPVDKSTGVQSDQIVILEGFYSRKAYPDKLRRIRYFDTDQNKRFVFLTNNFTLSALTITQLFQCRWQIEIFFKWIKQHLRIKAFYGTTENAVKTQIWIAITVYVLVAIIKKQLKIDLSLYTILQILSVTLFEKTPVLEALFVIQPQELKRVLCNQLTLFD
jgi:hypothetical protein